jgi:hypothetical protein
MTLDRDEQLISEAIEALDTEISVPDLMTGIREKLRRAQVKPSRRLLRPIIAAAVAAVLLGATAVAASLGKLDWLLDKTKVPFGDVMEESQLSASSQGVSVSIIAQKSYDNMSVIYVALEDDKGLGRVDESSQLVYKPGDIVEYAWSEPIYFDKETGVAVYQLRLTGTDSFNGKQLELDIEGISYGERNLDMVITGVDLAREVANGENIGGPVKDDLGLSVILSPGHVADIEGTQFCISALGVMSGYLAVQTRQPPVPDIYSHLSLLRPFLLGPDGERVEPENWSRSFETDADMKIVIDESQQAAYFFEENYFDVDLDDLEGYRLCYEGAKRQWLRGDWPLKVDFERLTEVIELKAAEVSVDGVMIDELVLTLHPLGWTLAADIAPGSELPDPFYIDIEFEGRAWGATYGLLDMLEPLNDLRFESFGFFDGEDLSLDSILAVTIGDKSFKLK